MVPHRIPGTGGISVPVALADVSLNPSTFVAPAIVLWHNPAAFGLLRTKLLKSSLGKSGDNF